MLGVELLPTKCWLRSMSRLLVWSDSEGGWFNQSRESLLTNGWQQYMAWKLPTDTFIVSAHIRRDQRNQRDNTTDFYYFFVVSQPYVTDHDEKLFWVLLLLIIRCFAQWMDDYDNLQILLHSFCQHSTYNIDAWWCLNLVWLSWNTPGPDNNRRLDDFARAVVAFQGPFIGAQVWNHHKELDLKLPTADFRIPGVLICSTHMSLKITCFYR